MHARAAFGAGLALLAAMAVVPPSATFAAAADPALREALERVARLRVLFGHQSVGMNVLAGLEELARTADAPLRIVQVTGAREIGLGVFGHAFLGENGKPLSKLQAFGQVLGADGAAAPDVAFMKFCYVDFTAQTDVAALFARYRATLEELRTRHPATTFVHITVPLTRIQEGPKAMVKRMLGRAPYGIEENQRRTEFNELLRRTYAGREPIFDLAAVEAAAPDGAASNVSWKGAVVPVLWAGYTDDGQHLNAAGRLRAARELVRVLAAVADQRATRAALR